MSESTIEDQRRTIENLKTKLCQLVAQDLCELDESEQVRWAEVVENRDIFRGGFDNLCVDMPKLDVIFELLEAIDKLASMGADVGNLLSDASALKDQKECFEAEYENDPQYTIGELITEELEKGNKTPDPNTLKALRDL